MPVDIARNVLTLKAMVPANWTTTAHQSMRRGSKATRWKGRPPRPPGARPALKASTHSSPAAVAQKSDPTEKAAGGGGADQLDEARDRPNEEACRADREQHPDPPRGVARRPPDAVVPLAPARKKRGALAVAARRPRRPAAVRQPVADVGRER